MQYFWRIFFRAEGLDYRHAKSQDLLRRAAMGLSDSRCLHALSVARFANAFLGTQPALPGPGPPEIPCVYPPLLLWGPHLQAPSRGLQKTADGLSCVVQRPYSSSTLETPRCLPEIVPGTF